MINMTYIFIAAFAFGGISTTWAFTCPTSIAHRNNELTTNLRGSKWDSLIAEDEEDDLTFNGGPPVSRDMKYNMFNIDRQRNNYESMKAVGGKDLVNDVYARDPESDTFWFVGKVARVSDVPVEKVLARQWPLIEEHAARLRIAELYPKWGSIELWIAPGDSEMDVAYNRPHIQFLQMSRDVDDASSVRNVEIGFAGELYDEGEEGFRTKRTADGKPMKAEIKSEEEKRQPSEADMDELMEMLSNQVPSEDD